MACACYEAMQHFCKKCGKQVLAEDMNLEMSVATCRVCSLVFSTLDSLNEGTDIASAQTERSPVPLPEGYEIDEFGRELTITYRWFSPKDLELLIFCVIWDASLILVYSIGLSEFCGSHMGWGHLFKLLCAIPHVAIGVGLTYDVICTLLNSTEIRVTCGELTIRHGPIPCPGNSRLLCSDVRQLFVTETFDRHKRGVCTYQVNAVKQDKTKQMLVGGLSDVQQALFLERRLDAQVWMEGQHVERLSVNTGEWSRGRVLGE